MLDSLRNFFSAIAPRICLACDKKSLNSAFCEDCFSIIEKIDLDKKSSTFVYKGPIASAIKRAKFSPNEIVARSLSLMITVNSISDVDSVDAITFVPLHWRRRLHRGFDLSSIFAQRIAYISQKPLVDVLQCKKYAAALSLSSSSEQRQILVADRYKLRVSNLPFKKMLVVDDIITTGATLSAASKPLQNIGIEVVQFAFARTPLKRT